MRRLLSMLTLVVLLLTACGSNGAPAGDAPTAEEGQTPPTADAGGATAETDTGTKTIRFVWFTDGPDQAAIEKLVGQFNEQNTDIKVEFSIVPYGELNQLLLTQAAAGEAPDVARVTEPGRFAQFGLDLRPYLTDAEAFVQQFVDEPMQAGIAPDGSVFAIPHDFTVNGPFINASLFKQANVPIPGPDASWQEWTEAARKVAEATGTPYAVAVDRSGHRLDGLLQAAGGSYFDEQGACRVNSPENRQVIENFVALHNDGTIPLDIWAGSGGNYAGANQFFVNGQLVYYLSGNWQVAQFDEVIGDQFEWQAVPNIKDKQLGSMPGGKFVMAFKNTKQPEAVARLIEFLGSKEAMEQYVREANFLPTRKDLIEQGIEYPVQSEVMNAFIEQIPEIPPSAYSDTYHPQFGEVANEVRDRVTQVLVGELPLEDALAEAQSACEAAIEQ